MDMSKATWEDFHRDDSADEASGVVDGVLVMRACPIHLGHERVLDEMLSKHGIHRSVVMLGGANEPMSLRHLFSYSDRRGLILRLPKYNGLRIVPLPDFPTDAEWLEAMDDILKSMEIDPLRAAYYGGCEEDIDFFVRANRETKIVNRFDGSSPKISATEVRDALIHGRPLKDLVNLRLQKPLLALFNKRWELFKRM